MQSVLMGALCRIGIFIVCAQVLVHIRPEQSYEKYLKLLVSIMILIQVFQPMSSLFQGEGGSLQERAARFQEELEEQRRTAAERGERAERLRERMTLEELQRRAAQDEQEGEDGTDGQGEGRTDAVGIAPVEKIKVEIGESNGLDEKELE